LGGALLQEEEKQRDFYNLLEACAAGDLANVKTILGWTLLSFLGLVLVLYFMFFWFGYFHCWGSGMFIQDPGSDFFHPGSRADKFWNVSIFNPKIRSVMFIFLIFYGDFLNLRLFSLLVISKISS
jgi:hypothetical protein